MKNSLFGKCMHIKYNNYVYPIYWIEMITFFSAFVWNSWQNTKKEFNNEKWVIEMENHFYFIHFNMHKYIHIFSLSWLYFI